MLITDYKKVCRTCLEHRDDLKYIFNDPLADVSVADMIMTCTSVVVSEQDGLPSNICNECVSHVATAYKFKKKCEQVDNTLRCLAEKPPSLQPVISATHYVQSKGEECVQQNSLFQTIRSEIVMDSSMKSEDKNCQEAISDFILDVCDKLDEATKAPKEKEGGEKKKLHICQICSKRYVQHTGLVWHMRVHTGERPFLCNHCGNYDFVFHMLKLNETKIGYFAKQNSISLTLKNSTPS